ncbi:MAG: aspartyl/asparaginyl beta-hydroxylase domain-containing protein [Moorea sp. SIO1G6]|uniref:aspartyl/asparaginyl beta-hydroxylase domain-containing protein n=1 Tax=Moorena sp. SIO1G6 TaxID=2607840 RepID=UPI0013C26830|nr:aspartyl/asparaginyl beta-hydroxylase domain-containing protein [Moorena sp. SIO1G6]NES81088.1 aspartyl/asparaginyl beta-hydroxylase domain-containing protein [Moorena sp. SIO2B7]NET62931.1 aspartyl/asparaginyl beta-hydroxylase domain-containing protein [Moorena sp. SIO1G6]
MVTYFELLTQLSGLTLNWGMPFEIDSERVLNEFQNVFSNFQEGSQSGIYNDGGWKAIGLITSGGDVREDREISKVGKPYIPTPALQLCPYIRNILNRLPADKKRVRFMSLQPGSEIKWHVDHKTSLDYHRSARFHIPIITSSKVEFKICHNLCKWDSGKLYYGDFSFPHMVKNNWDKTRIHLVIDLVPNDELKSLFSKSFLQEEFKRKVLRNLCKRLLGKYQK